MASALNDKTDCFSVKILTGLLLLANKTTTTDISSHAALRQSNKQTQKVCHYLQVHDLLKTGTKKTVHTSFCDDAAAYSGNAKTNNQHYLVTDYLA